MIRTVISNLIFILLIHNNIYSQSKSIEIGLGLGIKKSYSYYFVNGNKINFTDIVSAPQIDFGFNLKKRLNLVFGVNFGRTSLGFETNSGTTIWKQQNSIFFLGIKYLLAEKLKLKMYGHMQMSLFAPSHSPFKNDEGHLALISNDIRDEISVKSVGFPVISGLQPEISLCYPIKKLTIGLNFSYHFVPTKRYYLSMSSTTSNDITHQVIGFQESFSKYSFWIMSFHLIYPLRLKKDKK